MMYTFPDDEEAFVLTDTTCRIAASAMGCIQSLWSDVSSLPSENDLRDMLLVPPEPGMGDWALPCFRLAKQLHISPVQIAEKICGVWSYPELASAAPLKGYVNFSLNRINFAADTVKAVLSPEPVFGSSDAGRGSAVCIDYSSINIAKRFHIGHLSTTMIGNSLKRIFDFLGYRTVSINHLGDWGTQFGKLICAYKKWGSDSSVEQRGIRELTDLYVRFHKEAETDDSLNDEAREWFRKIENGDHEAVSIFNRFKELTLRDTQKTYSLLGVTFDSYAGESFYNDKIGEIVQELKDKNLLTVSEGASVVDLSEDGMPPLIVLRSDGASLYATRDLAAAIYRRNTYNFSKSLYVVAYQQDLHFRQLFRVLEKMGHEWAKDCVHVAFGMVSYEGKPLSTREGHVIYLEDLLMQAQEKALDIIREKSPDLENKENVARQVGIGAVTFSVLYNNRIKDIDFRWEQALNFDGESAPYLQYTHARCCSVLRKAERSDAADPDWEALTDNDAHALLLLISRFPDAVSEAAVKYEPCIVARSTMAIAQAFNHYYYEHRILDGPAAASAARLAMTDAVRQVVKTGLYLLGIEAPERM